MRERAETALQDPKARLERALIEEYLQLHGESLATVSFAAPPQQQLLIQGATQNSASLLDGWLMRVPANHYLKTACRTNVNLF